VHASQQNIEFASLCTITRSGTLIKGARFKRVPAVHVPRFLQLCKKGTNSAIVVSMGGVMKLADNMDVTAPAADCWSLPVARHDESTLQHV
jgi:hypothetical protein